VVLKRIETSVLHFNGFNSFKTKVRIYNNWRLYMGNKPVVFMVMPFGDNFIALYNHLKERFKENYIFTNAGDLDNQQNILKDIVEGIGNSNIVISDLTGLNPNVFYELGLAHAMDKKCIIITQDISELPFDLKSYRAVEYSLLFNKIPELEQELHKLLQGAIDGSVKFGNPISDYLPDFTITSEKHTIIESPKNENVTEEDDSESKGFIDFIAEIEENTNSMTEELTAISVDMKEMKESVENANSEIERVNNQSGKGGNTASFIRSVCRKLSVSINGFSNKFSERIAKIDNCWSSIENGFLALLEDKHIQSKTNMEAMKSNITALESLLDEIDTSDTALDGFKTSMENCLGIERKLTQAITNLIAKTEEYLSVTDRMSSSIERICSRSEIVFKELEI
jgi:DNA repair ATPase RecN